MSEWNLSSVRNVFTRSHRYIVLNGRWTRWQVSTEGPQPAFHSKNFEMEETEDDTLTCVPFERTGPLILTFPSEREDEQATQTPPETAAFHISAGRIELQPAICVLLHQNGNAASRPTRKHLFSMQWMVLFVLLCIARKNNTQEQCCYV
jgi:hypothetical protein